MWEREGAKCMASDVCTTDGEPPGVLAVLAPVAPGLVALAVADTVVGKPCVLKVALILFISRIVRMELQTRTEVVYFVTVSVHPASGAADCRTNVAVVSVARLVIVPT
jgi:hypothetical protein